MWHWLLTSTTYGTWLPGDARGSVTSVRDYRPGDSCTRVRVEHDMPGEAWEAPVAGLQRSALALIRGNAVWLTAPQAEALLLQLKASAKFRDWRLLAVAIMANDFHIVVVTAVDFDPARMLQEFKANGSRALNQQFPKPASGTWWTKSGSKRKLRDEAAVAAAVNCVLNKQPHPLVTWSAALQTD